MFIDTMTIHCKFSDIDAHKKHVANLELIFELRDTAQNVQNGTC